MKQRGFLDFRYGFLLAIVLAGSPVQGEMEAPARTPERASDQAVTYVIPIRGMVQPGMLFAVGRHVERAEQAGADVVIFHMDTPGGALNAAEHMIRLLAALPEDIRTYTFVDQDALSAGALIALATDAIYMAPQSRIGASALVTPGGDLEEGDMKEKAYSATIALVQSTAEAKGYDRNLVEAMMRLEYEYKIGDEVISPAGRLLTLSESDATRIVERNGKSEPLLAQGIARDMDELLDKIGRSDSAIVKPILTPTERMVFYAKSIAVFFLIAGVLGVYIEFRTPGFGVPGVLGLLSFLLFFWAQNIAGTARTVEALVFIIGLGLLMLEIFVFPGFGVPGIAGIALMVGAVFAAMVQTLPGRPWLPAFPELQVSEAIVRIGIVLIVSALGMWLTTGLFTRSRSFSQLALMQALDREHGYESSDSSDSLLGRRGQAATALRPSGIGQFDGRRVNVIARGEFIEKDAPIKIVQTRGNRVVVDPDQA